jgi:WD40 repeat protein
MPARRLLCAFLAGLALALAAPLDWLAAAPLTRTDRYGDPLPPGAIARLGTMRFRCGYWGRSFAFSPDGKWLAMQTPVGTVYLCDGASGKPVHRLQDGGEFVFLDFSPDGRSLAVVTGTDISMWEAATGKRLWRFPGEQEQENWGVFSPDGARFVSTRNGRTVYLWEAASGRLLRKLAPSGGAKEDTLAVSPDGRLLAETVGRHTVKLREVTTGREVHTLPRTDKPVALLRFSPDGRVLLATDEEGTAIHLWETTGGKELGRRATGPVLIHTLRFSPDGKRFAGVTPKRRALVVWDVAAARPTRVVPLDGGGVSLAFSPDSKVLAVRGDDSPWLVDLVTGKTLRRPVGPRVVHPADDTRLPASPFTLGVPEMLATWNEVLSYPSWRMAFLPGGRTLVDWDCGALRFWDARTGVEQRLLPAHTAGVDHLAFSADGKSVATAAGDGTIRVWATATGTPLRTLQGRPGRFGDLALSADGRMVAAAGGGRDRTVRLWAPDGRAPLWVSPSAAGTVEIGQPFLSFSPGGTTLAVAPGFPSGVSLRSVASGRERHDVRPKSSPSDLAFSPDGKTLALLRYDGLGLWDVSAGRPRLRSTWKTEYLGLIHRRHRLAFSPDGKRLAVGVEKTIWVWEAATGKLAGKFERPAEEVLAVAFTPSGQLLSLEGDSLCPAFLDVWDVRAAKKLGRLEAPGNVFHNAAFSPDGRTVAASVSDTSVLVWDVTRLGPGAR